MAAPISSGSAGASQSCRQIQLKDHETLHKYSLPGIVMRVRNALLSACAGEFILIGLSVDTIHRGTTMFDRHPTQRPR